jgi:hypothetical protein
MGPIARKREATFESAQSVGALRCTLTTMTSVQANRTPIGNATAAAPATIFCPVHRRWNGSRPSDAADGGCVCRHLPDEEDDE